MGFNWIDLVILALLAAAIVWGWRAGLLLQLFVITGFFGALFFGGWLFPHLLPIHDDRTLLTLVNTNLVLIFAIYAAVRGYDLSSRLHYSIGKGKFRTAEAVLGVPISVVAVLIVVWLLGVMVARLPFESFSNSANESFIARSLNNHLPPVPAVFAVFSRQVNPNSSPYLFTVPHSRSTDSAAAGEFQAATDEAAASTVRITSFGCGGLVAGSGFVTGPDLVVTNAHVIAGVRRPIVKYNERSYEGTPILFNSSLDFAVLRTKGLPAKPLALARQPVELKTTVAVAGYPGGNYAAVPGVVRNKLQVFGRNIYDVGVVGRNVYEVQTRIGTGSSGGPLILPDGRAAGMIFAQSNDLDDYAFALTSPSLLPGLEHAEKSTRHVSTGACLAD